MVIRAAGILPETFFSADRHFLLVAERHRLGTRWGEPGGLVDPGETARGAGIREAYEETRGALGSQTGLWWRLGLWPKSVDVQNYRCYIAKWNPCGAGDIPRKFHASKLLHGAFGETKDCQWVEANKLYDSAMHYEPGSGKTMYLDDGKKLRGRIVGVIRRTDGFKEYVEEQSKAVTSRYASSIDGSNSQKKLSLVTLRDGRAFAVLKSGNKARDLVLKDVSWMNPSWNSPLLKRAMDAVWIALSTLCGYRNDAYANRLAVFAALEKESYLSCLHRNCWLGSSTLSRQTL